MKPAFLLRCALASAALAGAVAAGTPAQAQIAYALSGGNALIRFDLADPGTVTTVGRLSGATLTLDGLDFRPSNGLLYGYDSATNLLVTVNTNTAVTTLASTPGSTLTSVVLGIDFNPTVDRLRVVNDVDENLRITPDTGVTDVDGTLAFATGDVNANEDPNVVDVAYTNNDTNAATGTTLYYIDTQVNALVTTTAPNAGTLTTIGGLGFDVTENLGFDIFTTAGGANLAYATLQDDATSLYGLYAINLTSGAATLQGSLGSTGVYGLAIQPSSVSAPEPGTLGLLALGALPVAGLVARRRRAR